MAKSARGHDWKQRFLKKMAETGIVSVACRFAKVDRSTPYKCAETDEDFKRRWEEAAQEAIEAMEHEGWRRGNKGVLKPVFYKGEQVATIREYSDTLLMFMLSANAKEKYGRNVKHSSDPENPMPGGSTVIVLDMPEGM